MSDDSEPPPFEYLLECSRASLRSFVSAKLNSSANLRKELLEVLNEWVEARALAILGEWFVVHGEKLIALAVAPPASEINEVEPNERTVITSRRYEFWRDERRRVQRRR